MKRLIRKILREEINKSDKYYRFLDKISSIIEKPYIKNMYERFNGGFWDITDEDDQEYILKNIFGDDISIKEGIKDRTIYDDVGNEIYDEYFSGKWFKYEYDDNGNLIYQERYSGWWKRYKYDGNGYLIYEEHSDGYWWKYEYDDDGNLIYIEQSDGYWEKREYDDRGNKVYSESSEGRWRKFEYDDNGNQIYFENSYGRITDRR
jgi:YD repeat-containing protein